MEHKRRVYIAALRGPAMAAGTEIVAVSIDLTRQKVHETNLLDCSHFVDNPRTLPAMVHQLIIANGRVLGG